MLEWIISPAGRAACAASAVTLIALMIVMSLLEGRLNRRQSSYRLMTAALILAPAGFARHIDPVWQAAFDGIGLVSFLMINFAVLALYTSGRRKDRLLLAAVTAIAVGAAVLQARLAATFTEEATVLMPVVLVYLVASGLLPAYILPRIGQKSKAAASLAVYFLWQLASFAHDGTAAPWLAAAEAVLPIAYYLILFFILFQRTLERMQSVYISSIRDGLTGLYIRKHFLRKANRYIARGLRVSVLFLDIDNFKKLNDTEGHQKADEALKRTAAILMDEVSGLGTAGRYGGEELVAAIASPGVDPAAVAEKIRRRIAEEAGVTVSVGVSAVEDGVSVEAALKDADEAMYVSKTSGKNRVTVHTPKRV